MNGYEAFTAQIYVMEALFNWIPPNGTAHRQVLLPYIQEFWTNRIRERFFFYTPTVVEAALTEARSVPETQRIRAILRAVRIGVWVKLPQQALDWLNAG